MLDVRVQMLEDGCRMTKLGPVLRERLQRKSRSENGASEASVSFHEELQRKARYFFAWKKQRKNTRPKKM